MHQTVEQYAPLNRTLPVLPDANRNVLVQGPVSEIVEGVGDAAG